MKFSRNNFEKINTTGIKVGEFSFLKELINNWTAQYPNDLRCEYFLASIAHLESKPRDAVEHLTGLLMRDPENVEAYELLYKVDDVQDKKAVASFIHVLTGKIDDISTIFPWAVTLRAVRNGIRKGELANSEKLLRNLLGQEDNNPLVAIEHCRLSSIKDDSPLFRHLSEIYSNRWPECLQFKLFSVLAMIRTNEEVEAVKILHSCVSYDPEGVVARRMFGADHEFFSLWLKDQFIDLDIQIPSSIAVALKWNLLPEGKRISSYSKSIDWQLSSNNDNNSPDTPYRLNLIKKEKNSDTPVYVILSTYTGMERKYGKKTTEFVFKKLEELSEIVNLKPTWEAITFFPDELSSSYKFGMNPIKSVDAWQIKLAINDLESYLRKQSKMIGAILIVGGHDVVPFHNLPNPTDDSDSSVNSDNPYSTVSGNYLISEWPVGRLPGEAGADPGLILEQIRQVIEFHKSQISNASIWNQLFSGYGRKVDIRRIFRDLFNAPKDFGYTTAVWRRSSLAAYRPLGKGSELRVTPPYDSDTINIDNLMKAKCAYFNLHGLADTPDWYGQRDFSELPSGPDFPVAITANQIQKIRNNVDLVFSEACYGGNIINKSVDNSMALKLISVKCQGLVVSTCIAYGSVFTPLIGADLLAFIFWKYIKDGFSFGESLLQAKIGLTKVMTQRQGYLDGEDQKTLISFVLYGDPLGYLESNIYLDKKPLAREAINADIKAFSDQDLALTKNPRISKDLSKELGEIMQSYIPSLNNADIKIREQKIKVNKIIHSGGNSPLDKNEKSEIRDITQVMVSQKTRVSRVMHEQYARVTMDENGKIIKLAVSR
ncbi:MAG: C25 family cysteine peptidase [Pelolinea sp.]|nr:C25 family cysteine peptidase [Pelolinea sp.]